MRDSHRVLNSVQNTQEAGEERLERAMQSRMMQYIDKHVFLHRLYISLHTQFGTNQVL